MNYTSKAKDFEDELKEPVISVQSLMEIDFGVKEVEPLPETMTIWDTKHIKKTWKDEDWDELIPNDGFIHDFVLAHRGYASPTAFWLWGGIMAISTMLGRDAWLGWGSDQLFANFYALLVGPAGTVKKSTVIGKVQDIIQGFVDMIPNEAIAFQKRTPCILGKTSEASLYMVMENQKQTIVDEFGDTVTIETDGKVFACINELSTFLSKQSYSSGIVEKLTDMYDCKRQDSEVTRSRGMNKLTNIYATFFGASTPEGMKDSIPESAFGGGFMSRLMTVYCKSPTRVFPMPVRMVGIPSSKDLKQRLAWLSLRARGEYELSEQAYEYYADWYYKWYEHMESEPDDRSLSHRQDIITLKLATILCCQRYNHPYGMENIITKADYQLAEKIIAKTIASSNVAMDKIGQSQFFSEVERVRAAMVNYQFKHKEGMTRKILLTRMSGKKINVKIVDTCLEQLFATGELKVTDITGKKKRAFSSEVDEVYWIEGGHNETAKENV